MVKIVLLFLKNFYLELIFIVSFLSVLGSLYFSDVLGIEPCSLCWWQRIFMYSIFILSATSLIFKVKIQKIFLLSLSLPGLIFALYHYLMQTFGLFKEISACTGNGKPCDVVDIQFLGFITIPLLSLAGFVFINFLILQFFSKSKVKAIVKNIKN